MKRTSERQVLFWLAIGLLFTVAVLTLSSVLLPFVAGLVIAYAVNPLADMLQRAGIPRIISAALIVLAFLAIVVLAIMFLIPTLAAQVQQLVVSLPGEITKLQAALENWARDALGARFPEFKAGLDQAADEFAKNWASIAGIVANSVWAQGRAVVSFISILLITPVVLFYTLVDWNRMIARIKSWLPRDQAPTILRLAGEIDTAISAFIRGQGLVCIILGIYYVTALSFVGLEYGLLVGIATGILSFVPFVGWALGLITASVLALVQGWPDLTLFLGVLAIFAGSQILDAAFLSPKIVGSRIGLHPVWLIFALMTFSTLFGTVGVLVAVPLAAAVGVLVRFALELYLNSSFYESSHDGGPEPGSSAAQSPTRGGGAKPDAAAVATPVLKDKP
ncbi:MAG: AI-2E family transporter [Pseudomonadota bacterium]